MAEVDKKNSKDGIEITYIKFIPKKRNKNECLDNFFKDKMKVNKIMNSYEKNKEKPIIPAKKPEVIDKLLTKLSGKDRIGTIELLKCTMCPNTDLKFKNAISRKEYSISGMCQQCQDKFFGKDEPEPDFDLSSNRVM